jgi:hypothetical protein
MTRLLHRLGDVSYGTYVYYSPIIQALQTIGLFSIHFVDGCAALVDSGGGARHSFMAPCGETLALTGTKETTLTQRDAISISAIRVRIPPVRMGLLDRRNDYVAKVMLGFVVCVELLFMFARWRAGGGLA